MSYRYLGAEQVEFLAEVFGLDDNIKIINA